MLDVKEYGDRLKACFPSAVRANLDTLIKDIDNLYAIIGDKADLIVGNEFSELVLNLENKMIKNILAMKKLQEMSKWAKIFTEGIEKGLNLPELTANDVKEMKSIFKCDYGGGKAVSLENIIRRTEQSKTSINSTCEDDKNSNNKSGSVKSTNIIILLTEEIGLIEESFEKIIPGSTNLLRSGKFDFIEKKLSDIDFIHAIYSKHVNYENANTTPNTTPNTTTNFPQNLTPRLKALRDDYIRKLEIHKIFFPIFNKANTLVSIAPVLMTMLYEFPEKTKDIADVFNNIFNEFSYGAKLERLTLSLQEKLNKNREIDELKINADGIDKVLTEIINNINFNVLSYMRRMKLKTFIDDALFIQAKEIGLDLTGLNLRFGIKAAPLSYNDIKLEATRTFQNILMMYNKSASKRIPEEMNWGYKPSMSELDQLISKIKRTVDKYQMIPAHLGPVYLSTIKLFVYDLIQLQEIYTPIEDQSLLMYFKTEDVKEQFYSKIKEIYMQLNDHLRIFNDFMDISIHLFTADQELVLKFLNSIKNRAISKEDYDEGVPILFDDSKNRIHKARLLKTISEEQERILMEKLEISSNKFKEFAKNYSLEFIYNLIEVP